jgi:hypothetical protein
MHRTSNEFITKQQTPPRLSTSAALDASRCRHDKALEPQQDRGMTTRRFPPWRADKIPGGYVVQDVNGQAIAYIYSRENEAEARQAKVLTKDEARRIAINIARLPELLGKACPNKDGPLPFACWRDVDRVHTRRWEGRCRYDCLCRVRSPKLPHALA